MCYLAKTKCWMPIKHVQRYSKAHRPLPLDNFLYMSEGAFGCALIYFFIFIVSYCFCLLLWLLFCLAFYLIFCFNYCCFWNFFYIFIVFYYFLFICTFISLSISLYIYTLSIYIDYILYIYFYLEMSKNITKQRDMTMKRKV